MMSLTVGFFDNAEEDSAEDVSVEESIDLSVDEVEVETSSVFAIAGHSKDMKNLILHSDHRNDESCKILSTEKKLSDGDNGLVYFDQEISHVMLDAISHVLETQQQSALPITKTEQLPSDNAKVNYSGLYKCKECGKGIKRKDNLKRHYLKVHDLAYNDQKISSNLKNVCIYPNCEQSFYHKSKMVTHLANDHNISIEVEHKFFNDMAAFLEWKMIEERDNYVCFTKRDGGKTPHAGYSSYVCQHDGAVNRSRKEQKKERKRRPSIRKDLICPARMLVRYDTEDNAVTVKYIKSHNHKIDYEDLARRRLPKFVQDEIQTKLLQNKSVDDVYSELRQEAYELKQTGFRSTALHKVFVQKTNIEYIQKKLNLPKDSTVNKLLIEDRLKALTSEDYNPILLYKPERPLETPGVSFIMHNDDTIFMFAIETEEQSEMFEKYCSKIVCLELTQPTSAIPYYILSVKVIDDFLQLYNVAHLVSNVKNDEIVLLFFNEMKLRCKNPPLKIFTVMTTLDDYGVRQFSDVFGDHIDFIYSKWHLHELFYTKSGTDYSFQDDLRHQVYFTLVAMIEELDKDQFTSIINDFKLLYEEHCTDFVSYLNDNYFNRPERWALCYQRESIRKCHVAMYGKVMLNQIKATLKCTKDICGVDGLLHTLLNIDQSSYLKQICKQNFSDTLTDPHAVGLLISVNDIRKVSNVQWKIKSKKQTCTVNWCADGCKQIFCQHRCLELVCFRLCKHMYTCSCDEPYQICSHIHKVHSLETGVSRFQSGGGKKQTNFADSSDRREFKLYNHVLSNVSSKQHRHTLETVYKNMKKMKTLLLDKTIQDVMLVDIDLTLQNLIEKAEKLKKKKGLKRCIDHGLQECSSSSTKK